MEELNKFREFLNEDLEEGLFDFFKKPAPSEPASDRDWETL